MAYATLHTNPFPGIRSYEPEEDELFFGRERRIRELIGKLSETRFLAIVGSSGCGKSSLIKAGLIPALLKHKVKQSDEHWKLLLTHPGSDPLGNLAESILTGFGYPAEPVQTAKLRARLLESPDALPAIIREFSGNQTLSCFLVIDQFEELFRFRQNAGSTHAETEATLYVDLFLSATRQQEVPVSVALSMRTDFIDDCTAYTRLNEAINAGYYLVPRMEDEEKRLAITGPLEKRGVPISEDLIIRLLNDVGDDPDQLPIMQHALMRTFDYWSTYKIGDEPMGISHYEAIGTMSEALSVHCEEIFAGLKHPHLQLIAEKTFKALTDFGTDSRGTRRPVKLSALCILAEARKEDVVNVIDHFRESGRAFLRPSYETELGEETTIDISHESIMRVWKRLRKWVDEERQSAQLYLRLSKSAELFQLGKTGLWINPELQLALQWREANKPNATWAMRYDVSFDRAMEFLEYSQKQFLLEIDRKESLQKRNLRQARNFAIILGAATLISILFLVVSLNLRFKAEASRKDALEKQKLALTESKHAEEQRREALIQKRISEQQQQIAEQQKLITEEQRLFAVGQQQIAEAKKAEAIQQKNKADAARVEAVKARDETEIQRKEAVSQKQIAEKERANAENSEKNTQRLRMLSIARSLAVKAGQLSLSMKGDLPTLLAVQAYQFNESNKGPENDPDIYNALSAVTADQQILRGHEDAVRAMDLSDDGKQLVSCSDDGKVMVWNLANPASPPQILPLTGSSSGGFRAVFFGKSAIVAGGFNGKLYLWARNQLQNPARVVNAHKGAITSLMYDPRSDQFSSAGADGKLILWKPDHNNLTPAILDSLNSTIKICVFDPASKYYIIGCSNGLLKVIHQIDKTKSRILDHSGPAVLSLAFQSDGQRFAAGDEHGRVRVWENPGNPFPVTEFIGLHASGVLSLNFSRDGKYLASSGFDRVIRVTALNGNNLEKYAVSKHDSWIYGVLFSEDGSRIISCSADKTIRIFTAGCKPLAGTASKSIRKNLSLEDWNQYIGQDIPYEKTIPHLALPDEN